MEMIEGSGYGVSCRSRIDLALGNRNYEFYNSGRFSGHVGVRKFPFDEVLCVSRSVNRDGTAVQGQRKVTWIAQIHTYPNFSILRPSNFPVTEFYPLVELSDQRICLLFQYRQSLKRRTYASTAYQKQESRENGCPEGGPTGELVIRTAGGIAFFCLGGGGLLIWTLFNVDEDRRVLRSSLLILACGGFCIGWFTYLIVLVFGLPPKWPAMYPYGNRYCKNNDSHGVNVSQKLLTRPLFLYYTKSMANVLRTDKQIAIIGSLAEGSSIRSIERITGVHRDTIMKLGVRVGKGCTALMDAKMRNLDCKRLEMDEIWGFVGKKERHVRPGDDPQFGNVWTYCAIDV